VTGRGRWGWVVVPLVTAAGLAAVALLVLVVTGHDPGRILGEVWRFDRRSDSVVAIVDRAVPLYLSGLAVALGLEMGLFNLGVEGQYRLAALVASAVGAAVRFPAVLHVGLVLVVAGAVGALWSGIAAVLRVRRGVHEVLSTLMLNFVATGLAAWLLTTSIRAGDDPAGATRVIPRSGRMPTLNPLLRRLGAALPRGTRLDGFLLVAVAVGVAYHLLVRRSPFGFELRALGVNTRAAEAAGISRARVTVLTMLASGAIAGLVGMAPVLGASFRYGSDLPTGLGFAGIAVAILGRRHAVGVAAAALLFGALERSAQILQLNGIPPEVVLVVQGVVILTAVIGYQLASARAA
jgi:general nucleoside transport system permease protein